MGRKGSASEHPSLNGLKSWRKSSGLSVAQLATLSGVSPSAVFRIEGGDTRVRESTATALERVLATPMDKLQVESGNSLVPISLVCYLTKEELETLAKVAETAGGKLTLSTISEIILGRRSTTTAPK